MICYTYMESGTLGKGIFQPKISNISTTQRLTITIQKNVLIMQKYIKCVLIHERTQAYEIMLMFLRIKEVFAFIS